MVPLWLLVLALAAWLLYRFKLRGAFSYWKLRGVPGPQCSAPFGSFGDVIRGRKGNTDFITEVYNEFRHERYVGTQFVGTTLLHLHDPEIIRQVFIKEFGDFNGRGMYQGTDEDFLGRHLFTMSGTPWRNMRVKLSPVFTTGKMKYMFTLIKECGDQLNQHLAAKLKEGGGRHALDIRETVARFTTDIITSVAFGVHSNSLNNPDSEFRRMGLRMLEPSFMLAIRSALAFFWPSALRALRLGFVEKGVSDFFSATIWDMVDYREKHGVERPDMLHLLIKLKNDGYLPPDSGADRARDEAEAADKAVNGDGGAAAASLQKLTPKELAAQCVLFFLAGFETSTATTTFAMYLLAKHPEVQDRIIEDLRASLARHGGKVSYDMLMDLPYLDMVIQETMRLYPAVPFLTREAMRARTLPTTDLQLEKGQRLIIPVLALHMDPQYWQKPEEFNPERFRKENGSSRTPMTYLPFGEGPRLCIGMRMAMVQVKMAMMTVLGQGEVRLPANGPTDMPLCKGTVTPTPARTLILDYVAKDRKLLD